jgi:hypothetical protein
MTTLFQFSASTFTTVGAALVFAWVVTEVWDMVSPQAAFATDPD